MAPAGLRLTIDGNAVRVPLSRGYFTMIDLRDAARLLDGRRWFVERKRRKDGSYRFYATRNVKAGDRWISQYIHRAVLGYGPGDAVYLGAHTVEEDAARACNREAVELFGEYARANFPPPP